MRDVERVICKSRHVYHKKSTGDSLAELVTSESDRAPKVDRDIHLEEQNTNSKKSGYADDLAILYSDCRWEAIQRKLEDDMSCLAAYFTRWRLRLSVVN